MAALQFRRRARGDREFRRISLIDRAGYQLIHTACSCADKLAAGLCLLIDWFVARARRADAFDCHHDLGRYQSFGPKMVLLTMTRVVPCMAAAVLRSAVVRLSLTRTYYVLLRENKLVKFEGPDSRVSSGNSYWKLSISNRLFLFRNSYQACLSKFKEFYKCSIHSLLDNRA
jgi:hypothetical protein